MVITLIDEKPKSLVFYSVNESWNNHHFKFYNKINSNLSEFDDYSHHAKNTIHNLRYQLKNKINRCDKKIYKLDIKLRDYEIQYGKKKINM